MAEKNNKKKVFSLFLAKKSSKNWNCNTVVGHLVTFYVYNMWFEFHKNRFTGFEDIIETVRKNVVLEKTRWKFFLMKKHEKILPQINLRYLHTIILDTYTF